MKQPGQFNCPLPRRAFFRRRGRRPEYRHLRKLRPRCSLNSWSGKTNPCPPAHASQTSDRAEGRRQITLTYRHSRFKVLLSLGFASSGASSLLFLLRLSLGPAKTDFALPVFTTFFAVSEAFIIFICVDMLLGKVVVRAEPGRGALFRGIGPLGSTWTFLLPMQADVAVERPGGDGDKYRRISIPQPSGRPFYFSGGISEPDVLEYIALVLRRFRA